MHRLVCLVVFAFFLASCSGVVLHDEVEAPVEPLVISEVLRSFPAQDLFAEAGAEYDVPADLLAAIAWKQSSFSPAAPHDTTTTEGDGHEHRPSHGWMGLTPEQATLAATLTGLDPEEIEYTREENVFAAAALLGDLRDRITLAAPADVPNAAWWRPTLAFSDLDEEWLAHAWARDVFDTLQRGLAVPVSPEEAAVSGHPDDLVTILPWDLPGLADVEYVHPPTSDGTSFRGRPTTPEPRGLRRPTRPISPTGPMEPPRSGGWSFTRSRVRTGAPFPGSATRPPTSPPTTLCGSPMVK